LKRVLIISPYFPPCNAADMQRARMSLPYFKQFGWEAEVVAVDPKYADVSKDPLLAESVPGDIKIHYVKALNKKATSKLGLGSIALRSLYDYRKKVNQLLRQNKFDLIYFSTTQFPVCILGAYWKKKFNIPYVIDMQDPWFSQYYQDKPKHQRPPKHWFSYRLNGFLEPIAMRKVGGLISVSPDYIDELRSRYAETKHIPASIITFGAMADDFRIAADHEKDFSQILVPGFSSIVYIGRGGSDMHGAITPLFKALKNGLANNPNAFNQLKIYFIGTSYAPAGQGIPSITPLATQFGVEGNIVEITDRINYFHTLSILNKANALFIPGSDDPRYTASKIFPYVLTGKPTLAVLNSKSPAHAVLQEYGAKYVYKYDADNTVIDDISTFLLNVVSNAFTSQDYNMAAMQKYSAENLTHEQCRLFDLVTEKKS
jgi:hypothetical protein